MARIGAPCVCSHDAGLYRCRYVGKQNLMEVWDLVLCVLVLRSVFGNKLTSLPIVIIYWGILLLFYVTRNPQHRVCKFLIENALFNRDAWLRIHFNYRFLTCKKKIFREKYILYYTNGFFYKLVRYLPTKKPACHNVKYYYV